MVLWAVWLFVIAASFALFEGLALHRGTPTLSRWVWTVSKAWPPFPYIAGFITGFSPVIFGGVVLFASRPYNKS